MAALIGVMAKHREHVRSAIMFGPQYSVCGEGANFEAANVNEEHTLLASLLHNISRQTIASSYTLQAIHKMLDDRELAINPVVQESMMHNARVKRHVLVPSRSHS